MVTKKDLRIEAKLIRNSLDIKKISGKIVENIFALDIYKKAKNIMLFYPLEHEIDLTELFTDKTKFFYLPKMEGEHLKVCPYKLSDELTISKFKTKEPITEPIKNTEIIDIIFVPALMVDKKFNRLGYGGGFYDKFLAKQSKRTIKITAVPNILIIDELPTDNFDEKINFAVCENAVYW